MRWDLVDRFDLLKKGEAAKAVKSFSGKEDFFTEHAPGSPRVPEPLLLEMIAQTGGVLYGLSIGFKKEVILAKIEGASFPDAAVPPCRFVIEARIEDAREEGAWISGTVRCGRKEAASAKILLVTIDSLEGRTPGKTVFNDRFLSHYDIWNVAKKSEGMRV
jgi:3-hydroxyacyl-[acyl-carrier-protein] dehydratase